MCAYWLTFSQVYNFIAQFCHAIFRWQVREMMLEKTLIVLLSIALICCLEFISYNSTHQEMPLPRSERGLFEPLQQDFDTFNEFEATTTEIPESEELPSNSTPYQSNFQK